MLLSFLPLAIALAAGGGGAPDFARVQPAEVHWVDQPGGHGAQFAVVYGEPTRPGLYVVRVRFPAHWMDSPHSHDQDRYVTVLEGVWYAGTGPVFDPAKATPLPAGSFMFHPANGVHWDGSAGDAPVVVQIIGQGPVKTRDLDPKAPEWIEVHLKP